MGVLEKIKEKIKSFLKQLKEKTKLPEPAAKSDEEKPPSAPKK